MNVSSAKVDPSTPVLIGVGQYAERVDQPETYRALSAVGLATAAAERALADTGIDPVKAALAVDTVAGIRQFEISSPRGEAPLGRSDNYPRSVCQRIGADPGRAILEVTGGQGPQHLISELAGLIAAGQTHVALLVGSEAISTVRHFAGSPEAPDFSEVVGGQLEDRGYGLDGVLSQELARHGAARMPMQYALFENARRARLGLTRAEQATAIGELFAPFTEVAATNPYSAAPVARSAAELSTPTERNRLIADPYCRFVVSRDQVNQGAAVVLASVQAARDLGVPEERWVYLHGHADVRERDVLDRADLSRSPAAAMAIEHALDMAGLGPNDVSLIDLYSCFPIAVSNVADVFGWVPDDPRGLTLTGGLPFFGGAGNNYSMHAIAETVQRCRSERGVFGLVAANGGAMSKYSVGIYSTTPVPWRPDDSARLQAEIDGWKAVPLAEAPNGRARIETFTVIPGPGDTRSGVIVGRLDADGSRFVASTTEDDNTILDVLMGDAPFDKPVYVRAGEAVNTVTLEAPLA